MLSTQHMYASAAVHTGGHWSLVQLMCCEEAFTYYACSFARSGMCVMLAQQI